MDELQGVFVAMATPFRADGRLAPEMVGEHLRYLEAGGLDGVLVSGTNGEGPAMSLGERLQLLSAVLAARGQLQVLMCSGCANLPDTIRLSREALALGADGLLIQPPFYFRAPAAAGVTEYYRRLLAALRPGARVLLYHIPSVTSVPIAHETLRALRAEFPEVCYGLKDTGGDVAATAEYVRQHPGLRVFNGADGLVAAGRAAGCVGAISASGNVWPEAAVAVWRARTAEERAAAQARLDALRGVAEGLPPYAVTKALLVEVAGLAPRAVRPPLADLTDGERAQLRARLARLETRPVRS